MKRTNMRSNPEDAEFYRRHRDRVRQMVGAGMAADKVAEKLVAQGVPAETARRIVRGVEQEVSVKQPAPAGPWSPVWLLAVVVPVLCLGAWYSFSTGRSLGGTKTLVKTIGLLVVCATLLGALWRGRAKK